MSIIWQNKLNNNFEILIEGFMKKLISIIFFISVTLFAQTKNSSPFLSVHGGLHRTSIDNFDENYDSKNMFNYGGGFGIPLTRRNFLYFKFSYYHVEGQPTVYNWDENLNIYKSKVDGVSKFFYRTFQLSMQYRFLEYNKLHAGLDAGIAYISTTETSDRKDLNLNTWYPPTNTSNIGLLLGAVAEYDITPNFSLFIEPRYTATIEEKFFQDIGGFNLDFGFRYYLSILKNN